MKDIVDLIAQYSHYDLSEFRLNHFARPWFNYSELTRIRTRSSYVVITDAEIVLAAGRIFIPHKVMPALFSLPRGRDEWQRYITIGTDVLDEYLHRFRYLRPRRDLFCRFLYDYQPQLQQVLTAHGFVYARLERRFQGSHYEVDFVFGDHREITPEELAEVRPKLTQRLLEVSPEILTEFSRAEVDQFMMETTRFRAMLLYAAGK